MSVCFRVVQIHYTHDAVAGDFQDSKHIHVGRLTPWGSLNRLALVEETRQSPGGRWFMYPVIVDTYTRYYTLVFCYGCITMLKIILMVYNCYTH